MLKEKYSYILLVAANLIWGGNFVIGRAVGQYIPPFTLSMLRWLIAFLALSPFLYKRLRRDWGVLQKHKRIVAVLALTGIVGYNTLLYAALHYTTSVNAAVLNAITPLCIAALSVFLLKEKLASVQMAGICLSVSGVLFTLSEGSWAKLQSLTFNSGDILVVLAVLCWGAYSVIGKKYANILPAYTSLYVTAGLGVLVLLPFSVYELSRPGVRVIWAPFSVCVLLYVGLLASIAAFLSWNLGVKHAGAAKAGVFLNLLPVFAVSFATLFAGETLAWYQAVGGGVVIAGVLLSSFFAGKPTAQHMEKAG
ncbi:DMT family transporter [Ectobacillus ponti]|uniref:DMT family transporter n=1 Tax=Ectobacillus ponti TaxID=2961894 RepID=A0AA42BUB6_9BACI|nr:DMT family transporter [Ectobacillus ponti]MCP8970378.1 DMT family transporter [Ectobacillus ponti]